MARNALKVKCIARIYGDGLITRMSYARRSPGLYKLEAFKKLNQTMRKDNVIHQLNANKPMAVAWNVGTGKTSQVRTWRVHRRT